MSEPIVRDRYVTIQAAANILSVTERFIYDLIMERALIAIKVGSRAVRVSEQSLSDFIDSRRVNPDDAYGVDYKPDPDPKPVEKQRIAKSKWMGK